MDEKTKQSQTYVQKTLTIENQKTKVVHQFRIKLQYKPLARQINLSRAVCQMHSQGLHIEHSHIFYQDMQRQMFVYLGTYPFSDEKYVLLQIFPQPVIRLKYRKLSHLEAPKQPATLKQIKASSLPPKNKQRTIGQVIQSVKKWRELWTIVDIRGKKIHTLQSAAQIIGINKKTLDDYAYQLHLGQMYSFDFQKNKDQKIGILRKFIRNKKKQMAIFNNTDNYWFSPSSQEDSSKR